MDECADSTHNCDINDSYTDNDGSFSCACNLSWEGDGTTCNDFDECSIALLRNLLHNGDVNAGCVNPAGSFSCGCNT